ncbi:hypothetical protein ANOM_003949 [Aspergillus nomiae NRRL 13137]|uniref:Transcription factor domain-containing protein n=1 Tax=Aspergillus nomiae NRRL (strain ATCC 15546 / NRRL 13137 / CBS 260.88 / M93) TaxID=1509407 RepID=A0A0L1J6H8_ASPN3|nr:uncharacterized protein ANOM_003949 [Aspergillus nomiae NRRL 13137]KNG87347.1 hypothetical protein ANOM_003949 [Aspergillus nomiae NRRL 13137]
MTRSDSLQQYHHHDPQRLSRPISSPAAPWDGRGSITEDVQVYQEGLDTQPSRINGANYPSPSPTIRNICTTDIQQGSTLLKRLTDISTLANLAERFVQSRSHGTPIPVLLAQTVITSLAEDPSIEKMSTGDQLAKSIMITGNTCRELELGVYVSPDSLCKRFTGSAIRWEALGLLFTWVTLALLHSPTDDRVAANFIATHGHQTWQRLGDLATEALDPTIVKPGAGNRKDFEIPLDIDDDALLAKGFPRSESLHSRVNDSNQSDSVCSATYIRARYILGGFRDELLQLSHAVSSINRLPKLKDLSWRYRATWLEMPINLHHKDTDQVEAMPYMTSFPQLLLFLDFLQGEYLIYKELSNIIESMRPQLLWHCKRTLNIVISLFAFPKMRAQTSPLERIRVTSLFICQGVLYGVPCAEYLILTLKEYNGNNGLHGHSPSPVELIRNISALISSLEHEYHSDDQLSLPYIKTYRNLGCALNDILESKEISALGCDTGPSSSIISPGSGIFGNDNIGSQSIDWGDDLGWNMQ